MRKVVVVAAVIIMAATIGSAEFGTLNVAPTITANGVDVNFELYVTEGPAAFSGNDWMYVYGTIAYPIGAPTTTDSVAGGGGRWQIMVDPIAWDMTWTFTLTAPDPGAGVSQNWGTYWSIAYSDFLGSSSWAAAERISGSGSTVLPQPTFTPDPNAGGNPIPTMNRYGVIAMVVLLLGLAVLVISRRK